ncbi:Small nuclear ribonucleoprotein-associated protein B [Gryllus bimaculatus]|nr:Small nuclear ribonucleoprotein-associated protein B [Gryllus bimaculatus]
MLEKQSCDQEDASDSQNDSQELIICDDNNEMSSTNAEMDTPGKQKLRSWLNKNLKIEMTDGRILIGIFLCTDRDGNVILGSCGEYLKMEDGVNFEEPRVLGLVMVPGRHIVSIYFDDGMNFSGDVM